MTYVLADRVKETTLTAGQGPVSLAGAQPGFQAFGAVMNVGDTTNYVIADGLAAMWEVGSGTYGTGNRLIRTAVLSSSSAGMPVNFLPNAKDIFIDVPAAVLRTIGNSVSAQPTLIGTTAGTGTVRLTTDGNAAGMANTLNVLTPNTVMRCEGVMLAKQTAPSANDSASWDVTFVARTNGSGTISLVSAATLGGLTYADTSMSGCVFQPVAADTSHQGINLSVTGVAGATIFWTFLPTFLLKV